MRALTVRKNNDRAGSSGRFTTSLHAPVIQAKPKTKTKREWPELGGTANEPEIHRRSGPNFGQIPIFSGQVKSNGSPLPTALQAKMEAALKADFSGVRIHQGLEATSLAAKAFTQGRDIYIERGAYNPATPQGQKILGHELAHVVQQQRGLVRDATSDGSQINADAHLEAEADATGDKVAQGVSASLNPMAGTTGSEQPSIRSGVGGAIQRMVPTEDELAAGRAGLRRADYGVVNPNLRGIRTRRGAGQSAADYYDHMLDTRRSVNRLMTGATGQRMLTETNARTAALNPGAVGDERNAPLTAVDIHSGRGEAMPMSHRPRHNGTLASVQRGYRYDGVHGAGQASRVNYDESAPSANRFNSLGHEMVHAWRTAHGAAVSPPQVSPQRNAPVLNLPHDPGQVVQDAIAQHAQTQEEFETVGLQPTPNLAWAPTENMIRQEHNLPNRNDYSGAVPGFMDQTIQNVDEATDDRSLWDRFRGRRSGVRSLLHHLES